MHTLSHFLFLRVLFLSLDQMAGMGWEADGMSLARARDTFTLFRSILRSKQGRIIFSCLSNITVMLAKFTTLEVEL